MPFKNYKSKSQDVHTLGAYGYIHAKYEVSMSNPVARRVCTDDDDTAGRRQRQRTVDKAWLYKALWLTNQISQQIIEHTFLFP